MGLKNKVTREYLKQYIGDEAIFKYYFGDFVLGKAYSSVFRKDDKCSTGFYVSQHGSIIYNDLATGDKYDFVKFVSKLKNISYYDAVNQIAIDFDMKEGEKSRLNLKPVKQLPKKEKPIFRVKVRSFTKQDLEYWNKFGITKQELIANNIYSVESLEVNDKTIYTDYKQIKFAYLFKDEKGDKYFKIYSPLNKEFKWFSNTPLSLPFGLYDLQFKSDTLVVTKSVKDCLILRKFFTDCIGLQNESKSSITHETVLALKKMYKNIIVFFDADQPGKDAAQYYAETYGFKTVHTPDELFTKYKIKDPGDFVASKGIANFEKWLKYIKVI